MDDIVMIRTAFGEWIIGRSAHGEFVDEFCARLKQPYAMFTRPDTGQGMLVPYAPFVVTRDGVIQFERLAHPVMEPNEDLKKAYLQASSGLILPQGQPGTNARP